MNKLLRPAVIAGNWKMNKTPAETAQLIKDIAPLVAKADCKVIACVPFIDLPFALVAAKDSNIEIGAQNCHWETKGAFTGEISANMLAAMGINYVIIGHSERRTLFGDTDITVAKRARAALNAGLTVILCVGEHLIQREQGITNETVRMQVKIALEGIKKAELARVIIAYEPIWAIGTGKTATNEQANEVCRAIRSLLEELYDLETADSVTIQYGGSMNEKNAEDLLLQSDIDGGLIGGASLVAETFAAVVMAAGERSEEITESDTVIETAVPMPTSNEAESAESDDPILRSDENTEANLVSSSFNTIIGAVNSTDTPETAGYSDEFINDITLDAENLVEKETVKSNGTDGYSIEFSLME